jgi:hypothetical protein
MNKRKDEKQRMKKKRLQLMEGVEVSKLHVQMSRSYDD